MFTFQTVLTASLLASTALAHFTLDYPTSRGFVEDIETEFCGGFNSTETRQSFPLGTAPIHITSHHTLATVDAFLSVKADPTSFDDFNTTSNGTVIPMVTNFFQLGEGSFCWNVNMNNLNIGLTNGSLVTLQIQFNGGDGNLFQCSDLVLLSDFTVPSNETCTTDAAASFSATATGGSATSTASKTSSTSSAAATTSKGAALSDKQVGIWGVLGGLAAAGAVGLSVL